MGGIPNLLLESTVSVFMMNHSWKILIKNNGKQQIQTSILIVNYVNGEKGNPHIKGFITCHVLLLLHITWYLKWSYLVTGTDHRSPSTSQSTCPTSTQAEQMLQEDNDFKHFTEASCQVCDGEVR